MKRKTNARSLVLISAMIIISSFVGPSSESVLATDTCTNQIFAPLLASLQAKSGVPLRLPLIVGGAYDAALYAEIDRVSRTRYVVRIGQNCERGYCPYGTVSGTKISSKAGRPNGNVVELAGGLTGYVTDGSKTLKNSILTWDQGQYRYAVTIYAAEQAAIIKVANSALSCVNR